MNSNLSGRWLISILLSLCLSMVLWALWQRSRDTGHVRQFWGAFGAACIQQAPEVKLLRPQESTVRDSQAWKELSGAPGLIHLRATLVDDRYFQWPAEPHVAQSLSPFYRLQFIDGDQRVELALDLTSGRVINLATNQSVRLIESSRQALVAYFQLPELQEVSLP